jgi:3-phenylpropionate/trans-cinnamate dioxygenase ferredoxin reductase subunit
VLIGAGWIGLEVAAAARTAGGLVTVLESGRRPLQRVLGARLGEYFADLHRSNGVDLRTGVSVREIVGSSGTVTGVRTETDLVSADVVVLGVGVQPNTELAADAGLAEAAGGGIAVDERLRSSDPAILAAGDVADAFSVALGYQLRVEHWDNAIRQGQLAARSVMGGSARYDWLPYFYTDQFDLGMEYVGHGGPDDDLVVRGDIDGGQFIACWLLDGRVRAGMNVNVWDVNDDLRSLIGRTVDPDRLADTDVELADV